MREAMWAGLREKPTVTLDELIARASAAVGHPVPPDYVTKVLDEWIADGRARRVGDRYSLVTGRVAMPAKSGSYRIGVDELLEKKKAR